MTFVPTRSEGLSRLSAFIPKAGRDYARFRNSSLGQGQHNHVSRLSPYIRHRLITEREVVAATLKVHSLEESEKFIQEVFWRTYYKGWLEHNPHIWARYKVGLESGLRALEKNSSLQDRYDKALTGQTGIACFDYWVSELIETGYLHNHARMWFASIWIFTLKLPWELGAGFFLHHLLDGDPASNTLSWRWVAGLHTKGKTYLARPDNIVRFTNGRFNPIGQLANHAEPLTEANDMFSEADLPQTHVMPRKEFLLLIHEDDCLPDTLLPNDREASGVIGVCLRSASIVDKKVQTFSKGAVSNALSRMGSVSGVIEGNCGAALIAACEAQSIRNIVTAYVPTGPSQDVFRAARLELERAGITVTQTIRPWDSYTWPYANRGFFKVKKKMSKILEDIELNDIQGQLL